jgi:OmpA-OmpF porin, OOP family
MKYYDGVTEKDIQGNDVELGGSMAFNLPDAATMFGLGNDKLDRYKIVYSTFGDILSKMYPEYMAKYPDYAKMIDKSYMLSVISNHPELMEGKTIAVTYAPTITDKVSSKSFQIQFETGSATIKSASYAVLDEILKSTVVAENLKVGVYGHTDNSGNDAANQTLSEQRANSVKAYLASKGITSARMESKGMGSSKPVADNTTMEGKAQNRRVEIVLGQ